MLVEGMGLPPHGVPTACPGPRTHAVSPLNDADVHDEKQTNKVLLKPPPLHGLCP